MTYQLHPLLTQLDNRTRTAGNDCAVDGILNAVRTVSDGRVGPPHGGSHADWVHDVRRWAGELDDGLLLRTQTFRALTHPSMTMAFRRAGLRKPRVLFRADYGWGSVLRRLADGWIVMLAVDYGVLNRGDAPSGSLSFGGGHLVVLANRREGADGHAHGDVADALMDGRTRRVNGRMHTYPRGWQRVRLFDYRAAAGAWGEDPAGAGHVFCILVKPGRGLI